MKRQLLTAFIVAVTAAVSVGSVQADCGGFGCHSYSGFDFTGFHARFGCSPREAYLIFQKNPQLITRFPEMARILQAEFGAFPTGTVAPGTVAPGTVAPGTVSTTETVVGPGAPAGGGVPAPAGGAPAVDPAVPAAAGAPAAGAAPATPVDAAPAAANPAPAAADPAAAGAPPAAAEGGEVIAPNAADAAADPAVPPVTLPDTLPDTAAISPELEPLLGLWVNESETDDQPIAKINLASDGNAVVTVNTALGQQEVRKPFSVEDGTFKLDGSELAKVISANADKVVLDANGTNLTFVRP